MGRKRVVAEPVYTNNTPFRQLERVFKKELSLEHFYNLDQAIELGPNSYSFKSVPGLILFKNLLSVEQQQFLVRKSLQEWTKPPNLSNLDAHFVIPPNGLWNTVLDQPDLLLEHRVFETRTVDEGYLRIDRPTDPMAKQKPVTCKQAMNRMRWATLGYQYNWTDKVYFYDRSPPFPQSCDAIVRSIVKMAEPWTGYSPGKWKSEAGIINFYHPGDSLTAHQDKSEENTQAPLVSMSVGLDCAFLIGTDSREDMPIALHLQSGDCVVMSGPCRNAFHGVPRVEPGTCPPFLAAMPECGEFMSQTRLNLNVRQVL
ncbi:hypothetical protein EDD86DRAFT_192615 [Gorgonomyces haynaldii]|nr:hypothetical protein EDD86DRAFT_192615 [Gorgonomyces haynaldii]